MAKTNDGKFDPTRFDYSLSIDAIYPPTLAYIHSGFQDYGNTSQTDHNAGRNSVRVNGDSSFTNAQYMEWIEGYLEFQLTKARADADAIREARKIMAKNPTFARMLDLHKRGLL